MTGESIKQPHGEHTAQRPAADAAPRSPETALRTAVLVPCYNEALSVRKVVEDFLLADPGVAVYVYDNNSSDDTARIAADAGAVVVREYRQGKGRVVRSMFRDIDADIYVMVDGDDTSPAEEALALRTYVAEGSADMVIGDRLSSTYFEENTRPLHGVGNRLVRTLVNQLFGSDLHDIMTGCRCMSRTFVKTMPVMSAGFEIETEMTIHALDKAFLIKEVPISYRDRSEGSESKLNTLSDGTRVLRMLLQLFRDYRPMRFFGALALVFLIASVATFIVPLDEYLTTGLVTRFPTLIVSVTLGLGSMLSFACGVLLDSIRTHSLQSYELERNRFAAQDNVKRFGS
jgi:glycosyltransferase involved in cell wall biosynthesis